MTGQPRRVPMALIVASCLLGGLVISIVLTLGVFGGAEEHVIMGTALIGWALGWASLTVLSTRWTDQPQRWAAVPAAIMALAGASLLVVRPDANGFNALGWVWPPMLIVLAVWIVLQARKALRSRVRAWMLYPASGLLVLTGLAGTYETVQEQVDRSTTPRPGQMVSVGGRSLYIHCMGSGGPTVVLVSGLGETSAYWGGWIQPAVAHNTLVCAYDRAGQGWSDPPPTPQDGDAVAADLHTLLDRAKIPGPYVLAGHSTGGVYARIFAAQYPDDVVGMVMLDSQPTEALSGGLPTYPLTYAVLRRATAIFPPFARIGLFRLLSTLSGDALPSPARDEERATTTTGSLMRSQRDEFAMLPRTLNEAAGLTTLGDKPLIVVTALVGAQEGWAATHNKMVKLSTNSVHRTLSSLDHPEVIHSEVGGAASSRAIVDVVTSVRAGSPLSS